MTKNLTITNARKLLVVGIGLALLGLGTLVLHDLRELDAINDQTQEDIRLTTTVHHYAHQPRPIEKPAGKKEEIQRNFFSDSVSMLKEHL